MCTHAASQSEPAAGRSEEGKIGLQGAGAAERGQEEEPPFGAVEFGAVGRVFQAIQVGLREGVKAVEEWNLADIGEARHITIVCAGGGPRRCILAFVVHARRGAVTTPGGGAPYHWAEAVPVTALGGGGPAPFGGGSGPGADRCVLVC